MGSSDQETTQGRLARAAAALAEAEVVARARASGLPPATGTASGAAQRPAAERRAAGRARSRPSRAKAPGTGWGSQDPGERPDWAPPPEESDLPTPGADVVREDGAAPEPDALSDAEAESVARAIVLRQLSMAPRSRSQLEKKLRQRGCDDDVAAEVLDRFTEVGLVDDEAYAQMLVRSKQSGNGLARKALAHELRKQGIDQEIADEALGQVGAGDERARAELLVEKKLRSMRGLDPAVQARRLAGMLARKGYSGEVAWPVIRDALDGLPEHRRD